MEILCFFAGIACVYFKTIYPLCLLALALLFRPKLRFCLWFMAAVLFACHHQGWHESSGLGNSPVIKGATLQGYIASIPVKNDNKTQFQLVADTLNGKPVKARILLNCYNHCPNIQAGEYWQFRAKIKKPRNLGNPGGFDFVRFLKARHIDWTGYIQGKQAIPLLGLKNRYPLLSLRSYLADRLNKIFPDKHAAGITQALTLGVTNHIDKNEWGLFRRTGTIHLMVISGAHIGLVAGLCYYLFKWLWCRFSVLCLYCPAQRAASIVALGMAFIYALLAGFAVPAQRALMVCFFMFLRYFCSQKFSVWQAWRYALLAVLLFEPHSVLMPGFYLSFIAVAILLLVNQRFKGKGLRKTLTMQIACMAGLMPYTLFWFSYGAVNGLIANLIAVPFVGFIIIPLALVTLCLSNWAAVAWLTTPLKTAITGLMYYLSWVDSFSFVNLNVSYSNLVYPIALSGAMSIIVLLPKKRLLPIALLLAGSATLPSYERISPGEAKIDLLDVGQGLAVVIRTATHHLIYDTGVKFYQGSDMASLAIIPYLETLGIKTLDKVIISHPDLDHRGGLSALEKKYKIGELIVDDPAYYHRGSACHHYPSWTWDGISFRFFSIPTALKGKNNHSCVLQVKSKGGQVLLTGDIEKSAERYLVKAYGQALQSAVLLIPHHSSKSSSSRGFLKKVAPDFALSSYGFDNRYHFPHPKTVQTYNMLAIPVFNTVACGKITIHLSEKKTPKPLCHSASHLLF